MAALTDLYNDYVMPTYARFELDLEEGSGARVWDTSGREYLDFGAGIAVCSLGHAHPGVTEAVSRQAARLVHTSNLYRTTPQAELARRIVGLTGPGKVFFCNSGAEANEGLIKLARKHGSANGRHGVLTFEGSFHGRTMACISATGQDKVKAGFAPLLEGFRHARFNDLASVEAALGPETGAVLVEPVQGEGGIHVADAEFLRGLRALCDARGLLLFFDEVQCGLGRTGEWCGWRSIAPDVRPDGVSWAKGIANGFPLGAFWACNRTCGDVELCNLLGPGTHGTTYGGNPVVCAAGLAVLDAIERDDLLAHAGAMGVRLADGLRSACGTEVRGLGLMVGVEVPSGAKARDMVVAMHSLGLLAIPSGESVVRFLPPLNVTESEIDRAVEIAAEAFRLNTPGVPT
jgi:predicted acetylornithine/succinylornithine family transaminase